MLTVGCRVLVLVVGYICFGGRCFLLVFRVSGVDCQVLTVDVRYRCQWLLPLVPDCRVSVVDFGVAHFFHCRCPALGKTLTHAKERLPLGIDCVRRKTKC